MDATAVGVILTLAFGAAGYGVKLYIEAADGMIGCTRKARQHLIEAHEQTTDLRRTLREATEDQDSGEGE